MSISFGVVDLFCGIGGLTCGLEQSGLNVVAGYDIDDSCKYTYAHNNNAKFINKDINEVTGQEIKQLLKDYDIKILAGCAPCQPFSHHQKDKKNRKKHKDWKLLYQYGRIVKEVLPDVVSMENVPELDGEKVFKDFIITLKECGYCVNYDVINAAEYGIPQRRKRLLLLAAKGKAIKFIKPTHKDNPITVRMAIGDLPRVMAGKTAKTDRLHVSASLSELNMKRIKASKPGGSWRDWPEELKLDCHKKDTGKTYGSVYGRMEWDKVAPTITTQFTGYGTGRFGHPSQNRALTLREGAILQTFPSDYSFIEDSEELIFGDVARHIGNAVPPRLGEIIGLSIIAEYEERI